MSVDIIIPARLNSTRLKEKALLMLGDYPVVVAVYKRAKKLLDNANVVVATDSKKIYDVCKAHDCHVEMTSPDHTSGTDRVYEVAKRRDTNIIVNIQGDEPFFNIEGVRKAINAVQNEGADVATIASQIKDKDNINDPNCVKVVVDNNSNAIYFSRAPIPFDREGIGSFEYLKHIGIYVYKKETLQNFIKLKGTSKLENIEKLEQLRLLENGIKIRVVVGNYDSVGIDTEQDYKKALNLL